MSGSTRVPLQALIAESSQEIEDEIRSLVKHLEVQRSFEKDRLNELLKWVESITRMFARLAADRERAMQIERETLLFVKELRWDFLRAPQVNTPEKTEELRGKLNVLLTRVRQLPSTPLLQNWPESLTTTTLLHSIYRRGNMSLVLQFLLAASEEGRMDVVTAFFDYAHAKLLEILHRTCGSMRIVCNSDCHEIFDKFSPSLSEVTRVRPNLHCRLASADRFTLISSADLNADFASHLEAGVIIERTQANPDQFVNSVWSGAIPLQNFRVALNKEPYRTSHVLLGLKSRVDLQGVPPASFPLQEISADIYELLASQNVSGYVDFDRNRTIIFINIRMEHLNPELLDAITRMCTSQFHDWFSVIPIEEVINAEERDSYIKEKIGNIKPVTILYFSSGTKEDVVARARRIKSLARNTNSSVRCTSFFVDSKRAVYGIPTKSRAKEHYLCLVHLSGLVAASPVLDENEIDIRSILRYMKESESD